MIERTTSSVRKMSAFCDGGSGFLLLVTKFTMTRKTAPYLSLNLFVLVNLFGDLDGLGELLGVFGFDIKTELHNVKF